MAEGRAGSIAYWFGAVVLVLFGALAIFSIGAPFFLTGIAMLAVGRWRREPSVIWPVLLGVWSLVLVYLLIAPGSCTATTLPAHAGIGGSAGHTTCTNPLGIEYSGPGVYNPPLLPALLAGLAIAAAVVAVVRRVFRARTS
jgi:hypothetical protein